MFPGGVGPQGKYSAKGLLGACIVCLLLYGAIAYECLEADAWLNLIWTSALGVAAVAGIVAAGMRLRDQRWAERE